jgi:histidyl-tRNA synthetase
MTKKLKFQRPTGMRDILPEEGKQFQKIYNACESVVNFYGFKKIETPILEQASLYEKGTGLSTDIVKKQMFSLKTKGGDFLALRPELTPGTIRAYLENGLQVLPQPVKLYSFGPVFRYEHPQFGRYRQFHQFNLEVVGDNSPAADAQIIQIFYNILNELKIKKIAIEVNSIGDNQCRPYYKKLLSNYFRSREQSICPDCRRRLKENPLRILDCKEEKCQEVVSQAPQIINHLCEKCYDHFKEVLEFLDEAELPYRLNPYLVRGLDYYTKTVFEIFSEKEEENEERKRPIALAGGGRYDVLTKMLGGEETPAAGGALGIERIASLLSHREAKPSLSTGPHVFIAQLGSVAKKKSFKLLEDFRKMKILAAESFGRDSLRAQFKMADRLKVRYTLLLGQKEVMEEKVIIKDMKTGKQDTVKLDKVVKEIKKRLKK